MQNVLIVNVNWLGDVIFSSPVFKAIKENHPKAHVACLAVPRVKEILESIAGIDEVIIYDEEGRHRSPWAKWGLIRTLRQKKFDAVFLLHGSFTRALLVFLAKIPQRVGYDTKSRGQFLTHRVLPPMGDFHRSDYYLNVIESFVKVSDRSCALEVSVQAGQEVDQILKSHGVESGEPFVVANLGGNWDLKRWSQQNFVQLIDRLCKEEKIKTIIPGSSEDHAWAQSVAGSNPQVVILAGKTNLKQLIALMKRAKLVVSADSGPLHIASAVGTPTIGLFGPTRPEVTGPRGKGKTTLLQKNVGCNRAPCYYLECPDNVCMKAITVDEVLATIKRIL